MEVFFDQENIQGGDIWFKDIGNALQTSKVCLVFVGEEGVGACQKKVLVAIIQHTEDDDSCKIIPVILASQNHCAKLPWFLTNYQWIVFESATNGNALEQLKTALNKDSAFKIKINRNPYKGLEYFDDAHFFS